MNNRVIVYKRVMFTSIESAIVLMLIDYLLKETNISEKGKQIYST